MKRIKKVSSGSLDLVICKEDGFFESSDGYHSMDWNESHTLGWVFGYENEHKIGSFNLIAYDKKTGPGTTSLPGTGYLHGSLDSIRKAISRDFILAYSDSFGDKTAVGYESEIERVMGTLTQYTFSQSEHVVQYLETVRKIHDSWNPLPMDSITHSRIDNDTFESFASKMLRLAEMTTVEAVALKRQTSEERHSAYWNLIDLANESRAADLSDKIKSLIQGIPFGQEIQFDDIREGMYIAYTRPDESKVGQGVSITLGQVKFAKNDDEFGRIVTMYDSIDNPKVVRLQLGYDFNVMGSMVSNIPGFFLDNPSRRFPYRYEYHEQMGKVSFPISDVKEDFMSYLQEFAEKEKLELTTNDEKVTLKFGLPTGPDGVCIPPIMNVISKSDLNLIKTALNGAAQRYPYPIEDFQNMYSLDL